MRRQLRLLWRLCAAALLMAANLANSANAQAIYSANTDYSITNGNPNGVWGYGYSTTLGGLYLPDVFGRHLTPEIETWTPDIDGSRCPHVSKNRTGYTITLGSVIVVPYQMLMHPGPNGEYSVLRFTAPNCGTYQYATSFIGQDWLVGTTIDAHVLKNGQVIWSGSVNGYLDFVSGAATVQLECGDTLDVAVGPGSNGNYFFDTTGVSFDVTALSIIPSTFEGFLPPVGGADATGGSFAAPILSRKLGSTIPVKFKATCCGDPVLTGIHTLQVVRYTSSTASDPPINATSTDGATVGNQFRLTGPQWHFNLDTSPLSKGTWKLIATLSDGSTHTAWITLK